jgi:hypothetical protein
MRAKRIVVFAVAAGVAIFGVASAVQAQPPNDVPAAPGPVPGGPAEPDPAFQELLDGGLDRAWLDQDVQSKLDVEALAESFPDVWAGTVTDYDTGTYTIQYDADADPAQVKAFLERIDAAQGLDPALRLAPEPVDFSTAETEAVMDRLTADLDGWAERLGVPDILGMGPDGATAEIVIYTSGDVNRDVTEILGWPSRVQGNTNPSPAAQVSDPTRGR